MTNETPESKRIARSLASFDPEIASAIHHELERQSTGIELIPSENFVSEAVLEA
ncbi:MAG TPA: hypothetical protein VFJ55_06355, partial [Chthoniobacterales bacterium]|nr:hypothetical protein [Chthoniobacterales bacterium]